MQNESQLESKSLTYKDLLKKLREKYPDRYSNPMLLPKIKSVVINCSVGQAGDPLEKARKILEELTNRKPKLIRAKKTIRPFGIHKKMPMGWKITLRGEEAFEFLKKAFAAIDNTISELNIDEEGNFAFGITEHIKIPGTKYEPELGTIGFDVIVAMERAGYRVKRRRLRRTKVPKKHRLTKEDVILFLKEMGIEVVKGRIEKEFF
ncbi:MAG: 50S ribosomal protein L5 [Candidatus Njordarchaeia archaeon]